MDFLGSSLILLLHIVNTHFWNILSLFIEWQKIKLIKSCNITIFQRLIVPKESFSKTILVFR